MIISETGFDAQDASILDHAAANTQQQTQQLSAQYEQLQNRLRTLQVCTFPKIEFVIA